MNNNKELADKLEEMASNKTLTTNDFYNTLKQAAQALRGEESNVPKVRQGYWYIDEEACSDIWDDIKTDQYRLECGNVYLTKEHAETIAENRKTLVKLRKFGCKDGRFALVLRGGRLITIEPSCNYGEPVRFATYPLAQQALEAVGEGKVKQLIEYGVL